jgi:hypothetical protein
MGGMVGVIIPLAALLIAVLMVAALWLWWTGDRGEAVAAQPEGSHQLENVDFASFSTAPAVTYTPASMPAAQTMPAANDLLRVIRTSDDQLAVVIDGTTYRNMRDVSTDTARRDQFMGTLRSLAQFAQEAENVPAPETVITATPAQPAITPTPAPAYTPIRQSMPTATAPAAKKSMFGIKALGGNGKNGQAPETVEAPARSMAEEIEELLQARLMRMPEMIDRVIHIYSTPAGGVQIQIDDLMYESVGDVTDGSARTVIEGAIRDWEKANPI